MEPSVAFENERRAMVRDQLIARGILHRRILDVMARVPREQFIPAGLHSKAYRDGPLPIGQGQTISQPYMVAHMTALLDPQPTDRVLEIGTGSGYQTAVLAQLAAKVYTVERHAELSQQSQAILSELGIENVEYLTADGTQGWSEVAPFERILVTAASPSVPKPLVEQLAPQGVLLIPVGSERLQKLHRIVRTPEGETTTVSSPCVFVKLIGAHGW